MSTARAGALVFTFYSYKGGVGRSMAMANVADALARQGLKVAMIDFDLEAPGLEEYFPVDHAGVRQHLGLLDLLLTYKRAMSGTGPEDAFTHLDEFLFPIYPRLPGGGRLDLLPAGKRGDASALSKYATELQRFDWQDFFFNWAGSRLFEWLRRKLGKRYDVVLVDSRTGVTEMGGVCAYQLADTIVAVCAANRQNVDGTASTLADFTSPKVRAQRADRPLQIVVVPSRVEVRAKAEVARFRARFEGAFAPLQPEGVRFWELLIPYEPRWAFDESTAGRIDAKGGASPVYQPLTQVILQLAGHAPQRAAVAAMAPSARAVAPLPAPVALGVPEAAPADEDATAVDEAPPPLSEPSQSATRISYDPTRTGAPPDALLVHGPGDADLMRSLEQRLRRMGVRSQRLGVPADAEPAWADAARWATRSTHRVILYDVKALGPAGERLADLAAAPVVRVARDDADLFGTLHRALVGTPPQDPTEVQLAVADVLRPAADDSSVSGDAPVQNPYVGQRAYDEEDAGWFFGRDADLERILNHLRAHAVVSVSGPSGAGKSSLIRAGLVPAVRAGALDGEVRVAQLQGGPELDVVGALEALRAEDAGPLLLVVDDAHELPDASLDALVGRAGGGLRVLLTVQSTHPRAARGQTLSLAPLTREDMHRAMVTAADRAGVGLEEGLAERILDDLDLVATPLSALQAILRELFVQRRQGWLTHAAYAHSGHASGQTSADAAEQVFVQLADDARLSARSMFLRLVTADGEPRTVTRGQLPADAPLEAFADARVIWAGARRDGVAVWRINDNRLPGRWGRLTDWLADEAEFVRWIDFVQTAVQAGSVVLTWDELARSEQFAANRPLTPAEQDFVASARAWEQRKSQEEAERARRKRWVMWGAAGLFGVVVAMVFWNLAQHGQVERSEAHTAAIADSVRLTEEGDGEAARHRAQSKYKAATQQGDVVAQAYYGAALVTLNLDDGAVDEAARLAAEVEAKLPQVKAEDAKAAALAQERLDKARLRLRDAEWFKGLLGRLEPARFVILLDAEALLDTRYDSDRARRCPPDIKDRRGKRVAVPKVSYATPGGDGTRTVTTQVLRPGWKLLCQRIWDSEGKVVLVVDRRGPQADALTRAIQFNDKPLADNPFFAGAIGRGEVTWLVDEDALMRKTVLVARDLAFPPRNTRAIDRFHADSICGGVPVSNPTWQMHRLARQIDESLSAGGHFADAFLPYTTYGLPKVMELREMRGLDKKDALKLIRRFGDADPPPEGLQPTQQGSDAPTAPVPQERVPVPQRPKPYQNRRKGR